MYFLKKIIRGWAAANQSWSHWGKFNRGDYRTGKRLNMRKVIPYIASQFRKDKIWLRRTKPSKRQYQICLAIDDSSSMVDNHTKQVRNPRAGLMSNWQQAMLHGHPEVLNMSGWKHFETPITYLRIWYRAWEDLKFLKEVKRAVSECLK